MYLDSTQEMEMLLVWEFRRCNVNGKQPQVY
jgi:hypothetical protein